MKLTLKILSFKDRYITNINDVIIGNNGGTIGRSDDNTLILPDVEKIVSRHHATISFENGCYYLSDTSLSGIYINNQETPLHNATERIENGMTLRIGEYLISITFTEEQVIDDFPFVNEPLESRSSPFFQADEPGFELDDVGINSLMTDNFPKHEELLQTKANEYSVPFESGLQGNPSPLFDSYIAPSIIPPAAVEEIPDNLSFDDFFSESDLAVNSSSKSTGFDSKPTVDDSFEAFFSSAVSLDTDAETDQLAVASKTSNDDYETNELVAVAEINKPVMEHSGFSQLRSNSTESAAITSEATSLYEHNKVKSEEVLDAKTVFEQASKASDDKFLFDAFLQGADIECNKIHLDQQTEAMNRVGQMFRKLIDGTIAVLRSRAEFKSLFRVNMTVIKTANNNPLKFTVSTDDVLRQLIENKTDGFLCSTAAIEEAFNDIMNHQLAMQAGIQASLTDLLKTFSPKVIEKQFEAGIVLQKKSEVLGEV